MSRVILHCDCNNFFASVETVLNPALKNRPIAVCGSESDRHGIVLAKNELAKKFDIKTAETVFSARKKCPDLVVVKPHYDEYVKYSKLVNGIYSRYTDMIESFGIDESWLDVTASRKLFGTGEEIADKIRVDVKCELGITVSVGVSFNKVFAKLGSDYKKPDAVTVINESNYKDIVFPLPVSNLLFVGKKTERELKNIGIRTIGDLAGTSTEMLTKKLGKMGEMLYLYANGLDESPVNVDGEDAKSVSNGLTFRHDLTSYEECKAGIYFLSEEIGTKLRAASQLCGTVSLTVKDEFLRTIQRQRSQTPPTDIAEEIAKTAYCILVDEWTEGKPIRMITVSANNLLKRELYSEQISLFDNGSTEQRKNSEKKENVVDKIRQKFGSDAIIRGSLLDNDIGIYKSQNKD